MWYNMCVHGLVSIAKYSLATSANHLQWDYSFISNITVLLHLVNKKSRHNFNKTQQDRDGIMHGSLQVASHVRMCSSMYRTQ